MTTYNVHLVTRINGEVVSKPVYPNMSGEDAIKVCERMNRLNMLAAKMAGKAFNYVFTAIKNG